MLEPERQSLEEDELFLVSFILLALGNGILIAIVLMIWRNQHLDVDAALVRWMLAAAAIRIFSLRLLRRYANTVDLAVVDAALAFAAMFMLLIHGFVVGAIITAGAGILHWYRALSNSPGIRGRT